jgi:hypothetical protein
MGVVDEDVAIRADARAPPVDEALRALLRGVLR